MKKADNALFLYLTGGLGNQLFQLAAGLFFSDNRKLILNSDFGVPRLNDSGKPELCDFKLPFEVSTSKSRQAKLMEKKFLGLILRRGVKYKNADNFLLRDKLLINISNLLISRYFRKKVKIHLNQGVGFSSKRNFYSNEFMIGYFQSYKWLKNESILRKMQSIRLNSRSSKVDFFKNLAIQEKPLVVHIRLGDYEHEPKIGILDHSYYQSSINVLWDPSKYKKIWVFSNDPKRAKEFLKGSINLEIRWVPTSGFSSAETLEIMRYGKGYIIANSTFSWWAASLSYTVSPEVIAPTPWFKMASEPIEIIPDEWKRIPGWQCL